jgi:PEGA domain
MAVIYVSERGVMLRRARAPAVGGRAVAVAVSAFALASCSTAATDVFKPKPTSTLMLIESNPAGAQAKTSQGKTCKTPCTMLISEGSDFTVTFTLDGYVPQTLPVHATMSPGGWTESASPVLNPGSLFPTLEPLKPPTGARRAKTASRPAGEGEGTQQ